jgi:flagellin
MPITLNTNTAASAARFHMSHNNSMLSKSITRLASGKRVVEPMDDAGGFAVAKKLGSTVKRTGAAMQNVLNGISMLEVQDGVMSSMGEVVNRMSELKALYHDVMKGPEDRAAYNVEFRDLQVQLFEKTHIKFNGVSLFARYTDQTSGVEGLFEGTSQQDNTMDVYASPDGEMGIIVSINRALVLSALTINASSNNLDSTTFGQANQGLDNAGNPISDGSDKIYRLANESTDGTGVNSVISLGEISVAVFSKALQNLATLRADNGASMSQLRYAYDNLSRAKTNLAAGAGRIMDVDIASESTRLSKYNVLVQASAAMIAQANAVSETALILLR